MVDEVGGLEWWMRLMWVRVGRRERIPPHTPRYTPLCPYTPNTFGANLGRHTRYQ